MHNETNQDLKNKVSCPKQDSEMSNFCHKQC